MVALSPFPVRVKVGMGGMNTTRARRLRKNPTKAERAHGNNYGAVSCLVSGFVGSGRSDHIS